MLPNGEEKLGNLPFSGDFRAVNQLPFFDQLREAGRVYMQPVGGVLDCHILSCPARRTRAGRLSLIDAATGRDTPRRINAAIKIDT